MLKENQPKASLLEVCLVFLRLGTLSFGGPAAHIAMMENEFVQKRQWLERGKFLELVGASNLIPGPTSTELAIYIGYLKAGWPGLIGAGVFFILPAMLIVLFLAHIYVLYGELPQVSFALYGVKPVIVAIIAQAIWNLGKTAVKDVPSGLIGGMALGLSFFVVNPLFLLMLSGVAMIAIKRAHKIKMNVFFAPFLALVDVTKNEAVQAAAGAKLSLAALFVAFFKIGAVLYGSGYVLLAFLWTDFVQNYQVLTSQQLLDAVAIGQVTPGPVFTTATFIGYVIAGIPGAIVATIAIFLPSFVFVPVISIFLSKIKNSAIASDFLAGVIVASLALMASVTWTLAMSSVIDWLTALLAMLSCIAIFKYRVNTTWLIFGGGAIGIVQFLF
ncbi:MAG: chromate efflux transporter [Anaeromusa sp.]|uniref:chromate efflux transporter n=1 Tax=Anaeromusa sp. TaxID=1872520 RepID=UPI002B1FADA5|nr:chromate efflux transporter [Anaeromusa sp.]MEA4835822.1 chromate efflux transporter [Anaeromusa sp.]